MTGPKGNNIKVCFPETLNVSRCEAEGNIKVQGKQSSLFPAGPTIKCLYFSTRKLIKLQRACLLYAGWLINLPWFQGARPDHVRVESSCFCFPRELVSFVRPREGVSFDPRHVTRFPPIRERMWEV